MLLVLSVGALASAWRPMQGPWPAGASIRTSVNINTAPAELLELLPNIGPALAQRIVEDRVANGLFGDLDDLDRVRGIGGKTIDALRAHATLD